MGTASRTNAVPPGSQPTAGPEGDGAPPRAPSHRQHNAKAAGPIKEKQADLPGLTQGPGELPDCDFTISGDLSKTNHHFCKLLQTRERKGQNKCEQPFHMRRVLSRDQSLHGSETVNPPVSNHSVR